MTRYRLLIATLALTTLVSGCNGYGRRDMRDFLNQSSGMPAVAGGRMAAALMVEGVSASIGNSAYLTPGMNVTGNKRLLNQGPGNFFPQNSRSGQVTNPAPGERGIIETIALNPSQAQFVGNKGTYGARYQGVSNGMLGRTTGFSITVPGINPDESQIAFSTDGSLLYVTAPEIKALWVIPMGDNGNFWGSPRQLNLRGRPSEIATARSEYGEHAAVVTPNGISLISADRFNVGTGGGEARISSSLIQFGNEKPTAVAFSPSGRYLFVGVQPAQGVHSRIGGMVRVCDIGQMRYERRGAMESYFENNRALGCFDGNPGMARGYASESSGIGSQPAGGLPFKLAVTPHVAVALNEMIGPVVLITPDIDDMDPILVDQITGSGRMNTANYTRGSFGFQGASSQPPVDLAIHPGSQNVIVAMKQQLMTYSMHNYMEMGRTPEIIPMQGSEITSLAMDPGFVNDPSGAEVMLIGDKTGFVWVAPLDAESFFAPSLTDRIPTKGGVIDLAIRTRTNFQQPASLEPIASTPDKSGS